MGGPCITLLKMSNPVSLTLRSVIEGLSVFLKIQSGNFLLFEDESEIYLGKTG